MTALPPLPVKKPVQTVNRAVMDTLETIHNQTTKQFIPEMGKEFADLFGVPLSDHAMAQEDLQRAREKKKLEEEEKADTQNSEANARRLLNEYQKHENRGAREQRELKQEMTVLTEEVVKLARAAGVDTKVHLEQTPRKIGAIDIKRLTAIIRTLRMKAEESKSASDLVSERSNAKRSTGMLAWTSGKQMKIHEQGTMQLQG